MFHEGFRVLMRLRVYVIVASRVKCGNPGSTGGQPAPPHLGLTELRSAAEDSGGGGGGGGGGGVVLAVVAQVALQSNV